MPRASSLLPLVVCVAPSCALVTRAVLDTPGFATDVALGGTLAYVADGVSGLRVVDVADPSSPDELGSWNTPGSAADVEVVGGIAWVADRDASLRAIDVSDPATPFEIGFFDTPYFANDVELSGDLAFVADGAAGLRVIDVSAPTNPVEIGALATAASDVAAVGGLVYVAANDRTVRIVDLGPEYVPAPGGWLPGLAALGTAGWLARGRSGPYPPRGRPSGRNGVQTMTRTL